MKTLDSEKRVTAIFQSVSVQHQLDRMREDIHLLYNAVDKLITLYEDRFGIIDPKEQPVLSKIGDAKDSPYI